MTREAARTTAAASEGGPGGEDELKTLHLRGDLFLADLEDADPSTVAGSASAVLWNRPPPPVATVPIVGADMLQLDSVLINLDRSIDRVRMDGREYNCYIYCIC
jgi:hypothetical protein